LNRRAYLSAAVALSALFAACIVLRGRRAPEQEQDWSRVVAALQQIAEEYPEALEQPETAPPRRLQLARLLDRVSAPIAEAEARAQLAEIRKSLLGTDYDLGTKCRELADRIAERTHLRRTPSHDPDLANGRRAYAQACAACHGPDLAHPSTAVGAALQPPAMDVWHPQYNWTPYEIYHRITYGGAETAMPSFEEGLSPEERWDIAFFLSAERWPPCSKELPPISASELALLGDFDLSNRFGYAAAACLRRNFLPPR
jgi:mono/diheme cytochrome c family protein